MSKQWWRFGGTVLLVLGVGCTEGKLAEGDLGLFIPEPDAEADVWSDVQVPIGKEHCLVAAQGVLLDTLMAGRVYEVTMDSQDPGETRADVRVDFYDLCGEKIGSDVSREDGTFAFLAKLPSAKGGQLEKEKLIWYAEYTLPGYPLFRQFDKRLAATVVSSKYRLFAGTIFDAPLMLLRQKPYLGYIQGSVYNLLGEDTVAGAKIDATSGEISYLADNLPIPDKKLEVTQSRGVFFISNIEPGEVTVTATLPAPDGRKIARMVRTWPVNSYENRTITQMGLPVSPDMVQE